MIEEPTTNEGRINYKKNQAKEKRIIYDFVKDNIMSVITRLKKTKECCETLMNLYEKKYPNQKRDLRNNFCNLKMEKDETIASLFTNNSQVKYRLVSICVMTDEDNLL